MLERHLEMAVDGDERKVIAKRIAVLYEDALKESEQAVRAWETVLEIDPNEPEALESLAQLHLAAGAFRELCEVYARKIEITDRADERRMLLHAERPHLRGEPRASPIGPSSSCARC